MKSINILKRKLNIITPYLNKYASMLQLQTLIREMLRNNENHNQKYSFL